MNLYLYICCVPFLDLLFGLLSYQQFFKIYVSPSLGILLCPYPNPPPPPNTKFSPSSHILPYTCIIIVHYYYMCIIIIHLYLFVCMLIFWPESSLQARTMFSLPLYTSIMSSIHLIIKQTCLFSNYYMPGTILSILIPR